MFFPFLFWHQIPLLLPSFNMKNKENETREEVPHRLDWTSRISIHPVLSFSALTPVLPPSLTHAAAAAAAHFLGHLFLRLFQLFEEFASQMGRIPTAPSRAPHQAICLWSLNGVFCVYTDLLLRLRLFLPRQGSAAVQEHDSYERSPLHFDLPNQWNPNSVSICLSVRWVPLDTIPLLQLNSCGLPIMSPYFRSF